MRPAFYTYREPSVQSFALIVAFSFHLFDISQDNSLPKESKQVQGLCNHPSQSEPSAVSLAQSSFPQPCQMIFLLQGIWRFATCSRSKESMELTVAASVSLLPRLSSLVFIKVGDHSEQISPQS
jgi:hypothetical protein